ncbi:MAG: LysR family transcriptional regulator [Roseiflexaceae bacterium]
MDIDQLIAFERIVREGSFSRAAWALTIAQPTISARIQALEQELGGPLFARNSRRISLTALGASFLPYARRAIGVLNEGVAAARLAHSGQRGRIAVGGLGSLAHGLFGPTLAHFHSSHPQVECYMRAADHVQIIELLYDGVIDMGLITWPCLDPLLADLTPLLYLREPVVFVVPKNHPLARRDTVTQADILEWGDPFLKLRWWQATHVSVARLATRAKSVADVPMEVARYLVLHGIGIGFFTHTLIAEDLAAGNIMALAVADLSPIYRDCAFVRLTRNTALDPAELDFVASLREQAERMGLLAEEL